MKIINKSNYNMSLIIKKTTFTKKKRRKSKLKNEKLLTELNSAEEYKTGPWDESEDERLTNWISKHGAHNWVKCAEEVKTRNGKQCREHWFNKLDENIKKGNWTSEDDLLILKFYKKFESWKEIIPIFENRTINSIKNRFFSILRKIAFKKGIYGNTDMVSKIGLDKLKQFLDEAVEEAENIYYKENKDQTKEQFENFMNEIENNLKYVRKGNFLDLNNIRTKNFNNVDNNNDNDKSLISLKNIMITNVENDNNDKIDNNMKNNEDNDSDSISYQEDNENDEDEKNPEKKIKGNIKKKKTYIKKTSKKEKQINLVKSTSLTKIGTESSNSKKISELPINSNSISSRDISNVSIKAPLDNSRSFREKQISQNNESLKKNSTSKINDNNTFEIPLNPKSKITTKISSRGSLLTKKNSSFYNLKHYKSKNDPHKFCFNTTSKIKSTLKGKIINPCPSFS